MERRAAFSLQRNGLVQTLVVQDSVGGGVARGFTVLGIRKETPGSAPVAVNNFAVNCVLLLSSQNAGRSGSH